MRQVAGLTAGSSAGLQPGSFQFRESNQELGFSLSVDAEGTVAVIPGASSSMVAEIPIQQPTLLGEDILNVGSACFAVRPPRPASSPEHRLELLHQARSTTPAVTVPPNLSAAPGDNVQTASARFGVMFATKGDAADQGLSPAAWQFLESLRDARSDVAERHRQLHPDPEELRSRLSRLDPGLWDRNVDHPYFARFAVAYATIPWEPRFDRPELVPLELHRPVREMSCLPWVPVTANLLSGPLGIVGNRSAVLAAASSAVISLSALTSPDAIEFSILTGEDMVDAWDWTAELPRNLFPTGGSAYRIAVADGMAHFDGAGLDHETVRRNEMGLIALGQTLDDLPDYCATVLQIDSAGRCTVTNHLGERVDGTPIGLAKSAAASLARSIASAVDPVLPPPLPIAPTSVDQPEPAANAEASSLESLEGGPTAGSEAGFDVGPSDRSPTGGATPADWLSPETPSSSLEEPPGWETDEPRPPAPAPTHRQRPADPGEIA
jgi:hypothetical protein